jgi:L-fucose isomerase-like protein
LQEDLTGGSDLKSLCVSIASSPIGLSYARLVEEKIRGVLNSFSANLTYDGIAYSSTAENIDECRVRVVFVATGGTERITAVLAEKSRFLILLAHKYYNSLPATIEISSLLRKNGFPHIVKLVESFEKTTETLERILRIVSVIDRFKNAKFGLIGGVSDWLVYSKLDPALLREKLGSEIIEIPVEALLKEYETVSRVGEFPDVLREAEEVLVSSHEVEKALKLYAAIGNAIKNYGLSGISIKCFDIIPLTGTTACLALSLLNSKGIPASCEGDLPLLISIAMGEWVSGKPVFMGNPSFIENNEIVIAHCTSPLVGRYRLHTHFETGKGVGVRVEYPVGERVTVYRVDSELSEIRIGAGTILRHDWSPSWCRTQVRIGLTNPGRIIEEPIGNHYALLLGNYVSDLEMLGKILGLKVTYL